MRSAGLAPLGKVHQHLHVSSICHDEIESWNSTGSGTTQVLGHCIPGPAACLLTDAGIHVMSTSMPTRVYRLEFIGRDLFVDSNLEPPALCPYGNTQKVACRLGDIETIQLLARQT
jgi:hypothetical protein